MAKAEGRGGFRIGRLQISLTAGVDVGVGVEAVWDAKKKKFSLGAAALLGAGIEIGLRDD